MLLCRSCFPATVSFRYVSGFMFLFWATKLMLLHFCCQKISFLCKHNFLIDEKHTQWHWHTKAKVFHEIISWLMKCPRNCISWNALKETFQCILPFRGFILKPTERVQVLLKNSLKWPSIREISILSCDNHWKFWTISVLKLWKKFSEKCKHFLKKWSTVFLVKST